MLPLARYRLYWQTTKLVHLPAWAGSTLRGAWGHALRRLACMTRQPECAGCPLLTTCPYPALFAPPPMAHVLQKFSQPPAPYVIEPAGWGERSLAPGEEFHFDVVLFGRALRELPLVTLAWRHALQRGVGRGDGKAELVALDHLDHAGVAHTVHRPAEGWFHPHETLAPPAPVCAEPDRITLNFHSPLRLQENGRALPPNRLTPEVLLMAATRRASLITEIHGPGSPGWDFKALKTSAVAVGGEKDLKWQDWTRRSARQQQSMQLGGVVGRWTLRGPLAPFLPALHLCQWLHLGKETVFGLGGYTLEDADSP